MGGLVGVNGVELFVRRFGNPPLPLLLVIHGGPTWDHSYLLPAVAELSDVAHVVVFDLRGHARSSRTPPAGTLPVTSLRPEYAADDVAALARHFGAGASAGQAFVLGFSYGGRIAMRVVDQHPGVVRGVILASTTAYEDYQDELEASGDYRSRAALCTEVAWDDPGLTGPGVPDGALSRAMAYGRVPLDVWHLERTEEWHRVLDGVQFSGDWNAAFAAGLLQPGSGGPPDAPRVLREWGGPVLIVHGSREMGFPAGVARRLHAEVPASTLTEIPEAAHMAHFDEPDAWLAAVRTFISEH